MTRREGAAFAAIVDAVVSPVPPLPPVARTDAVAAFDEMLRRAPRLNRAGLRAGLMALDTLPLARAGARLRALDRPERLAYLSRAERLAPARPIVEALRTAAAAGYYGDAGVLEVLRR